MGSNPVAFRKKIEHLQVSLRAARREPLRNESFAIVIGFGPLEDNRSPKFNRQDRRHLLVTQILGTQQLNGFDASPVRSREPLRGIPRNVDRRDLRSTQSARRIPIPPHSPLASAASTRSICRDRVSGRFADSSR